jgi:hypothetical protein
MKPMIGPSRGGLTLLAAGLVVCGAWAVSGAGQAAPPQQGPTPAPPFVLTQELITQRHSEFVGHAKNQLHFQTGAWVDHRRLLKGPLSAPGVGPEATLSPEMGAELLPDPAGAWADTGRVLALINLRGEDYTALHLQKGDTYVCARRSGSRLWAILVGVAGGNVTYVDSLPFTVKNTRGPARFVISADDDGFCTPCDSKWCCVGGGT